MSFEKAHDYGDDDASDMPEYASSGSLLSDMRLSLFYAIKDAQKRPRNTCIGFGATLTVVLVTGLILMGMGKSSVIFLRFAELTTGEMDALILAEGSVPFVNYTEVEPRIATSQRTYGSTPRWLVKGEFSEYTTRDLPPNTTLPTTVTNVLAVDSLREKEIGVGRAYDYRQIGFSEVQVLASVLRYIKVEPNIGKRAKLFIDVAGVLGQQNVALGGQFGTPVANQTNATANEEFVREFIAANPELVIPGLGNVSTNTLFGANLTAVQNATNLINAAIAANNALSNTAITDFLAPEARFVVADGFSGPLGKYPGSLGNMAIFDYHTFVEQILEQACYETLRDPFSIIAGSGTAPTPGLPSTDELEQTLNLDHYALIVVAMLRDRFTTYYKGTEARDRDMILWSNDLFYAIGIDFGGSAQYPIALALVAFDSFALFLNSIFFVSVFVIVALGALLVYTLLLTNSEERSFEVAMLRAQGMRKRQLFVLMTTQMVIFVLPGLLVAMGLLMTFNALTELALTLYTYAPAVTYRISVEAVVVPLVVGIFVPVIGNAAPIRAALKQSLRDALDIYRNKANETTVVATKLAELGMDPFTIMMAWLLVIVGFLVYYLVPLAFIFNELWLFFLVMNIILIMMLFGLCLITGTFQVFLERGFLWLMLWGNERRLKTLILKNFKAHSERNSKGYMMFTLSVACVVFGGVLFSLLATSIVETVSVLTGADVTVVSLSFDFPLNRTELNTFFEANRDSVADWSFETFPLYSYAQVAARTTIRNSIGFPTSQQEFIGLQENFLDAAFGKYVLVEEKEDIAYGVSATGATDVVRSLYTQAPLRTVEPVGDIFTGFPPNETRPSVGIKYDLIMPSISSAAATDVIGLKAGSFGTIQFKYDIGRGQRKQTITTVFLASTRALCRKFPGFLTISSIPFTFRGAPTFVTTDDFQALIRTNTIDFPTKIGDSNYQYTSDDATDEVKYRKLYVRLQPSVVGDGREFFVNLLQSQVNPYYHLTTDTLSVTSSVKVAGDMITIFFYFVSIIAIILDTLMLWLVFVSNVQLNAWSFAVLRSIGFTTWQLRRAFIYESLSIVMSGFLMGTLIGVIIAMTLVLQLNLFLQLPFTFSFPYALFFVLMGLSIVSACIAPLMPANAIAKRPIASVLKGG